jgi:hypothetical protein
MSTGKFPTTIGSSNPSSIDRKQTFTSTCSKLPLRQAIALISEHGDPAAQIGKDAAGGQNVYVRQVGEALAELGWQVDMFTRKSSPDDAKIVQHSPRCRTIRLTAGPETYIPRDDTELDLTANTEFIGMVGHDRLPLYYIAADVSVVPSHYESFGLVALEAMACGTPVVASDVGGLKFSVVSEQTGLLVTAQSE